MKTTKHNRKNLGAISAKLLAKSRQIVDGYRIVLEPVEGVGYVGRAMEFPGIMADGGDVAACAEAIKFALETAVATMLADGKSPPLSADAKRRTEQINIRVTPDEKDRLSEASAHRGFRGISDYVRFVALDTCKE